MNRGVQELSYDLKDFDHVPTSQLNRTDVILRARALGTPGSAAHSWRPICRVLRSVPRSCSVALRDILSSSCAARLTSCICGMRHGRSSNLTIGFFQTSVCAGPRSNTLCATVAWQCGRQSQIGLTVSIAVLLEPPVPTSSFDAGRRPTSDCNIGGTNELRRGTLGEGPLDRRARRRQATQARDRTPSLP